MSFKREEKLDQQLWEPLLIAPIIGAPELVVPGKVENAIASLEVTANLEQQDKSITILA